MTTLGRRAWVEQIMGMPISLHVRQGVDDPATAAAVREAFTLLRTVDRRFSTYRDDSEISRLNRGELRLRDTHPEVREVVRLCTVARQRTGGYFDAWGPADAGETDAAGLLADPAPNGPVSAVLRSLPEARDAAGLPVPVAVESAESGGVLVRPQVSRRWFDPSGLVKGWAVQRAADLLTGHGVTDFCLNAGGDIALRCAPGAPGWRVGVEDPADPSRLLAVLEVTDGAVATSGTARRGTHIYDPHTGGPATRLASVTITGPDLTWADVYATAIAAASGRRFDLPAPYQCPIVSRFDLVR
ncbi:MAG: FAD:protein FMN transferase [Actinocatenispora sp.]